MQKHTSPLLALLLVALFALGQSVFVLPETHQAMVIQFGDPVALYTTPGLKFKVPVIQQVQAFDKRTLDVDSVPEEVILADKKRIVVDTFARYRIVDMLSFYKSLQSEQLANTRLANIINSAMRSTLGNATLTELLSDKRSDLMMRIRAQVNAAVKDNGIEIVDVRIGRADLPKETSAAIYARMRTEREREAAEFRAQGQEAAQEIKSRAEKERTILLADADRQAQVLRGEGDAQATKVYAAAYGRDPEFYAFYRSMQAYKDSLSGDSTTMILTPDSEFFRFFRKASGR
jgi:membrane protease subunit HflC